MDFIFELLFEIILEGCIEITEEKKVPLILRILCAFLLVVFYCGLIGIFLFVAISNQSGLMFFITGIVALIILFAFVHKYKVIKKNSRLHYFIRLTFGFSNDSYESQFVEYDKLEFLE